MTKIESIENMVKTIFADDAKILDTNEYNELIARSDTQEERDLYTTIYNYLLKKKHAEVIKNVKY